MNTKKLVICFISILLLCCACNQNKDNNNTPNTETAATSSAIDTTETTTSSNKATGAVATSTTNSTANSNKANDTYFNVVNSAEYFTSTVGRGVEMKYNNWINVDNDEYSDLRFLIDGAHYENGLGTDGKTSDGYDNRKYSEDNYQIVKGKYDQLIGIFGFDDRTPSKAATDLVILEDGKETFRTKIDESNTNEEIKADLSSETKLITIRFEITGTVKDRIPMIIFADIKARSVQ